MDQLLLGVILSIAPRCDFIYSHLMYIFVVAQVVKTLGWKVEVQAPAFCIFLCSDPKFE